MSKKLSAEEKAKLLEGETVGKLNELIIHETVRRDGSIRYQLDFSNCPSMAEQHTGHLTDINYLMKTYRPDELASYIAAKNAHRREILGHDFSLEPERDRAHQVMYDLKQNFLALPDEVRSHFQNHVEFLKFIDNPANQEKMLKLGLMTKKQIEKNVTPATADPTLQPSSPSPSSSPSPTA